MHVYLSKHSPLGNLTEDLRTPPFGFAVSQPNASVACRRSGAINIRTTTLVKPTFPRILRLVQKWLKAGVLEDGVVNVSERGTGQGAVISPLLANIYLHYMLDHLLIATTMASAILQD